ncbi:DUF4845 domain-containing protein [Alkalilimnicola sp. S0819]|uniref:DUF4845 domain-containing protein n=1 Tax=Alkalilimnicola sp. S0819 TaxID=2613922 RepID=UPI0012628EE6|nr:DUF4845 domain-containing protein [Alkalilimnicola sp. S0819]KAB7627558.1 DUF4845 domain-containing protein [Alkalilimnicola sp. S0819]MPQ15715.1 DUF4845 domain-containing protein [Alkalilimnicola sp. S0819]
MQSNNKPFPRRQAGMTLIGWLLVFIFIAFSALIAMRLVPVYLNAQAVGSILQAVENDRQYSAADRARVLDTIRKRLQINDIDAVERDDIVFEQVTGGLQVTIEYEDRVKLVGNLDAVARFRKTALIPR